MTSPGYQITVAGRIGPILRRAFSDLDARPVVRHHVLLVRDDCPDALRAVLDRLEERGLEVDRVITRYR